MGTFIIYCIALSLSMVCYLLLFNICLGKNLIHKQEYINVWEMLFWVLVICVYENVFICFLLALFACYSLLNLSVLMILKNIGLLVYIYHKRAYLGKVKYKKEFNVFILVIIVVSGILYFFFPTEYLWGRRDPMLYVVKGVNIANTGSVLPETNTYLNTSYDEIKDFADLTYRGVYSDFQQGRSILPGDLTFQFLDFFPALLAIGYSLAGLDGLFRIQTLIALLCLMGVYYFTKRFFGKKASVIVAFLLAVCPAQIWSARITQTELFYQLNWLIGIYIFGIAWQHKNKKIMFLSGCVIGIIGLNRIDAYILGLGIYAIAIYYNLFVLGNSKLINVLTIGYTISACPSLVYSFIFSRYYVEDLWEAGNLSMMVIVNVLMCIITFITYILKDKLGNKLRHYNLVTFICDQKGCRIIICWIIFWISRLLYYARPLCQKGENRDWDFSQRAFFEFCWYTTGIAVVVAILGLYYVMKDKDKRKQVFLFLTTGFCMLIVYTWKPAIAMDHLWASRRWIPVSIPFVFILASYGLEKISSRYMKKGKFAIFTIVAIMGGFLFYKSKLFLFTPMLNEMQEQYDELILNMDSNKVYFAEMSHYASVLRFIYGENVYVLKEDSQEAVKEYLENSAGEIYFIGDIELFNGQVRYEKIYDGKIEGTYILQTAEVYPTELTKTGAVTNIYRLY